MAHKRDRAYRRWRMGQRKGIARRIVEKEIEEIYNDNKRGFGYRWKQQTPENPTGKGFKVWVQEEYTDWDIINRIDSYLGSCLANELDERKPSMYYQEKARQAIDKWLSFRKYETRIDPTTGQNVYIVWVQETSYDLELIRERLATYHSMLERNEKARAYQNECKVGLCRHFHRPSWWRRGEEDWLFTGWYRNVNRQLDEMHQEEWLEFYSNHQVLQEEAHRNAYDTCFWDDEDQFNWDADHPKELMPFRYEAKIKYFQKAPDQVTWSNSQG